MNKLKQVIADKCNELNITHQSLSKALGHSEVYLYDVMRKGVTTAKKDELIMRIGDVKEYKSDAEIISDLKCEVATAQLAMDILRKSTTKTEENYQAAIHKKMDEIRHLESTMKIDRNKYFIHLILLACVAAVSVIWGMLK